jgi:hypothetical protein
MKKTPENLEHRIQLKKIDIDNCKICIRNYPPKMMEKYGIPQLNRLNEELNILNKELEERINNEREL